MPGTPQFRVALLRSAAFRLAGLQAVIFALIVAALFTVTWWTVGGYVEQRLHERVEDGIRKLASTLDFASAYGTDEGTLDLDDDQYFGLFDASGRHLKGVVTVLPADESDMSLRIPRFRSAPRLLHVETGRLADGRWLVVGMDRHRADELLARLRKAYLTACLAGVVAALVAGFLTARRYLRRVEMIAAVAAQIVDGRLQTRLPVSKRQDEIDHLSAALNATWQRTEALLEGMRQLSTDVAHELRTPLAHLRFRLEEARSSLDAHAPARAAVDRSIDNVDHVLAVFGALLRISQIQSRQRRAGFEALDLSLLVATVVADYRPLFEDDGRPLQADVQSEVQIVGDRMLLEQLLVNLIENALRHTAPGTALTVRLTRALATAELCVADAGPGIPESQLERVLQRRVRLETVHGTPGTGLGLALVNAIADLHDAPLRLVDARPGLCVMVSFPIS